MSTDVVIKHVLFVAIIFVILCVSIPTALYYYYFSLTHTLFSVFFVVYLLQLIAEFRRIVAKDLLESFLGGLDELVPSLLQLYKAAAASGRRLALSSILNCLQKEVCTV